MQEIKRDSEQNIILFRKLIAKKITNKSFLHTDGSVESIVEKLKKYYSDYQLSLYLYSYASYVEILLLENFDDQYLENISKRISEYSYHYRTLYTDTYNNVERLANSSIESILFKGASSLTQGLANGISKIPVISKTQIDENLVDTGVKIEKYVLESHMSSLSKIVNYQVASIITFVDSINKIKRVCSSETKYYFDRDYLYVK